MSNEQEPKPKLYRRIQAEQIVKVVDEGGKMLEVLGDGPAGGHWIRNVFLKWFEARPPITDPSAGAVAAAREIKVAIEKWRSACKGSCIPEVDIAALIEKHMGVTELVWAVVYLSDCVVQAAESPDDIPEHYDRVTAALARHQGAEGGG